MQIKDKNIYFLFIFGISIQLIFKVFLPISLSADSYRYVDLIKSLPFFVDLENRTIGYPLFLLLLGTKSFLGVTLVIAVQSFLAILGPVLIYLTFRKFNISIAFVISLLLNCLLFHHWASHQIMTECLLAFLCCALIYSIFKFFYEISIKNLLILFLIIFLTTLVRPTVFYIGYFFILFFILYTILNFTKFNLKILTFSFLLILILSGSKNLFEAKFVSHNLWFFTWYWVSTALCEPNEIVKKNVKNCPEGSKFYSSEKYRFNGGNEKYANQCAIKCFNTNNGPATRLYFSSVENALNEDENFLRYLSSNYDFKDSPSGLNPLLVNKTPKEILMYHHNEATERQTPFIHIYFNLLNNYPYDFVKKVMRNSIIETFYKHPELFFIRTKYLLQKFYDFKPSSQQGLAGGIYELNYWAFTPRASNSLMDQGFQLLYNMPSNIYAQFYQSMERLHSNEIYYLYRTDLKPVEYFDNFFNDYNLKFEKLINNKSVSLFFAHNLSLPQQIIFSILKIFMFILIPIYMLLCLFSFLFNLIRNKQIKIDEAFYPVMILTSIGYISIVASFWISYMQRHLDMHAPLILPIIIFLIQYINSKLKKKN